jgi:Rho-type GTPase-activating protein 1/2
MVLTPHYSTGDPSPDETGSKLSRNLTTRLDKIKKQYKRDLLPLTQQRERLEREIDELKAHRDLLLEETSMLNLRNEELAQLTQQYLRRMEAADVSATPVKREKSFHSLDKPRPSQYNGSASTSTLNDEVEFKAIRAGKPDALETPASSFRPPKFLKWHGKASREHLAKEPAINIVPPEMTPSKPRAIREHVFQQFSALRFARCDHCGDKMWGSHLRCTGRYLEYNSCTTMILIAIKSGCHMSVHPKCLPHVHTTCAPASSRNEPVPNVGPLRKLSFFHSLFRPILTWTFRHSTVHVWSGPDRASPCGCERRGTLRSSYR